MSIVQYIATYADFWDNYSPISSLLGMRLKGREREREREEKTRSVKHNRRERKKFACQDAVSLLISTYMNEKVLIGHN